MGGGGRRRSHLTFKDLFHYFHPETRPCLPKFPLPAIVLHAGDRALDIGACVRFWVLGKLPLSRCWGLLLLCSLSFFSPLKRGFLCHGLLSMSTCLTTSSKPTQGKACRLGALKLEATANSPSLCVCFLGWFATQGELTESFGFVVPAILWAVGRCCGPEGSKSWMN